MAKPTEEEQNLFDWSLADDLRRMRVLVVYGNFEATKHHPASLLEALAHSKDIGLKNRRFHFHRMTVQFHRFGYLDQIERGEDFVYPLTQKAKDFLSQDRGKREPLPSLGDLVRGVRDRLLPPSSNPGWARSPGSSRPAQVRR